MTTIKKTVKKVAKKAIKKAQFGEYLSVPDKEGKSTLTTKLNTAAGPRYYQARGFDEGNLRTRNQFRARTEAADSTKAASIDPSIIKRLSQQKNGGKTVKKAVKKAQSGEYITKDSKGNYSRLNKYKTDAGDRYYRSTSKDLQLTGEMNDMLSSRRSADSVRYSTLSPREKKVMDEQRNGGKTVKKAKSGKQMIKRADGSYSQRGLWDNIRAAKGSGKKPTAAMLKQERKIKLTSKKK
jgi:hypothetical protein